MSKIRSFFSSLYGQLLFFFAGSLILSIFFVYSEPSILYAIDYAEFHTFNNLFCKEQLLGGHLPLWNPYVNLGRPFLADLTTASLYPPTLLFVVFSEGVALMLSVALHFCLAAFFMYKLALSWGVRRIWAGILGFAFILTGSIVGRLHVGHLHDVHAMCYIPILFWLVCSLRESFSLHKWLGLSSLLALQFLCGSPQFFRLTFFGLGVFIIGSGLERPVLSAAVRILKQASVLVLALCFAIALSAIQFLPYRELLRESYHFNNSIESVSLFALPWREWLSIFFFNSPSFVVNSESYLYPGFLFAVVGICGLFNLKDKRIRGLLFLAIVSGLVALGNQTPFFSFLYHLLPGVRCLNVPANAAVFVPFSLLLAAGCFLGRQSFSQKKRLLVIAFAFLVSVACAVFYFMTPPEVEDRALFISFEIVIVVMSMTALIGCLFADKGGPKWEKLIQQVTAGVVVMELFFAGYLAGMAYGNFDHEATDLILSDFILDRVVQKKHDYPVRIAVPRTLVKANSGMKYKYSNLSGYASYMPDREWRFIHEVLDVPVPVSFTMFPDQRIFDHGSFPFDTMNISVGVDSVSKKVLLNKTPDPRAYLVYEYEEVDHWSDAVERIKNGYNVHSKALIEKEYLPAKGVGTAGEDDRVKLDRFETGNIEIKVETKSSAILVLAEAWFPGWGATINGTDVPCFPVNGWMRGVQVPAGRNNVVLKYRSTRLTSGIIVTFISILIALSVLLFSGSKIAKRKDSDTIKA